MTGIIVDKFKNELFIFADGRVTADDLIYTDSCDKITPIITSAGYSLLAFCGDVSIEDSCMSLIDANKVSHKDIQEIKGQGTAILLKPDDLLLINIDNTTGVEEGTVRPNNNHIARYPFKCFPMFFGSGSTALSSAYKALQCDKTTSRRVYLKNIDKCYIAASSTITSMNKLTQIESIQL